MSAIVIPDDYDFILSNSKLLFRVFIREEADAELFALVVILPLTSGFG